VELSSGGLVGNTSITTCCNDSINLGLGSSSGDAGNSIVLATFPHPYPMHTTSWNLHGEATMERMRGFAALTPCQHTTGHCNF
jgi:hypothetical protein